MKLAVKRLSLKPFSSSTNLTKTMVPDSPATQRDFQVTVFEDIEELGGAGFEPCDRNKRCEYKQIQAELAGL